MKKNILSLLLTTGIIISSFSSYTYANEEIPDESAAQELFVDETADETVPDESAAADVSAETPETAAEEPETSDSQDTQASSSTSAGWPAAPEISSESAILIEDSTNTILYQKNDTLSITMGSPVKIMTVLVALENAQLDTAIPVTDTGVSGVYDESSNISLTLGETLTLKDYLYAIMLSSANDAALQVAEAVGGSVDNFVAMMNQKAADLGCSHTHFVNPTGFSAEGQSASAQDLAIIIKAALDNPDFATIANALEYTIPATDQSEARVLSNSFSLLNPSSEYYFDGIIGGKEGYSEESLGILACGAEKDGLRLFAVTLKGDEDASKQDANQLLTYGFSNFHVVDVEEASSGGKAVIPIDASLDQLTITNSEKNDGTYKQYYFADNNVGSAFLQAEETPVPVDNTAILEEAENNRTAASDLTINKSMTPYYIIAGVTAALFLLLLVLLVKVIRK